MRSTRPRIVEFILAALRGDLPRPVRMAHLAVLGALLTLGLGAAPVTAHALPERANPPMGGKVAASPAKVEVWFSQEVDPNQTTLTVIAPNGGQVDQGDTAIDLYDPHHQHVTVSLRPNLAPGVYTVQWHSRSILDSDAVDGSFTFTLSGAAHQAAPAGANVAAPTSAPLPPPLAASSAAPVAHQVAKPTNSSSSSSRTLVIVIIVVIALVLIGRGTRRTHKLPRHDGGADS